MIDISFLSKPPTLTLRSGMEYLDWQNRDFFNDLTTFFERCHENKDSAFQLSSTDAISLSEMIKKRTGIAVVVNVDRDHFSMRCGNVSPYHLLNKKGIEKTVSADDSVMGQTLRWLNSQALTGQCNLKTGRVEGDFQKVVFTMGFGKRDAEEFVFHSPTDGYAHIAAAVLHEVGHAFFSLYYISQTIIDNLLLAQVVKYYTKQTDVSKRVIIAKQLKTDNDIALPENVIQAATDPNVIAIGFEQGRKQRETRRTLSLGVERITGETLADIYAVRMGASLALLDVVSVKTDHNPLLAVSLSVALGSLCLYLLTAGMLPVALAFSGLTLVFTFLSSLFSPWRLLMGKDYDTPYRRMKAVLRENIAYINSVSATQDYSATEKNRLIADAKQMDALIEKQKPFFESTALQRVLGLLRHGRDAKKTDFEYFTAELAAPTLSLYTLLP